jgi:putative NIF3 family GTP cyclohydrolase 1 type 2
VSSYPTIHHIATWVRATLGDDYPTDTNGVWWLGDERPIQTLGIAIQGNKRIAQRAATAPVDAVLLHRPWGLGNLPTEIGVLAVHEALDERLTTAENPWLADALGFMLSTKIRTTTHRPLLTLATTTTPIAAQTVMNRLEEWFAPLECWNPIAPDQPITTIAFSTAMRPALLAIAAECGASLYLTGTLKDKVHPFLEQIPIAAVGIGQAAAEQWGLLWLGTHLQMEFGINILWLDSDTA